MFNIEMDVDLILTSDSDEILHKKDEESIKYMNCKFGIMEANWNLSSYLVIVGMRRISSNYPPKICYSAEYGKTISGQNPYM